MTAAGASMEVRFDGLPPGVQIDVRRFSPRPRAVAGVREIVIGGNARALRRITRTITVLGAGA